MKIKIFFAQYVENILKNTKMSLKLISEWISSQSDGIRNCRFWRNIQESWDPLNILQLPIKFIDQLKKEEKQNIMLPFETMKVYQFVTEAKSRKKKNIDKYIHPESKLFVYILIK